MEVVVNNYLPGDQRLVDKIVYELKSQGIFDQFRKECFSDVDTKPAYQNLRQRVEGSVAGFLREQSWRPDMNKNQVREMLRKTITESGFLETGVERIVDQVVNPKINTVLLPKVEEVVYSYLGLKKPSRSEASRIEPMDLLPTDLEAVSPESEPADRKDDKSCDTPPLDLEETKTEEDESPPFEPLEEQSVYVPQEENSVDSHLSGFSGLISHESNQSNENKVSQAEQDSQMSRNSSDSRLSIVTSDENSKMDICEDSQSQSKSIKSIDSNLQQDIDKEKCKSKISDRYKSRSESKSDNDRRSSKDSRSKHSSSSKDKGKNRDRKDSRSSKNDKDKVKDKSEKDRTKSSTSSSRKHSSDGTSKDKNGKRDSSRSDKEKCDKDKARSSHKDSRSRDKLRDSKLKEKSSSSDKHKHSSQSSHVEKHKKDKDKKKEPKSKDDHYSSKEKKNDRRSTDRDSNDGQSGNKYTATPTTESNNSGQTRKSTQDSNQGGGDAGNTDQTETTTKAPIFITGAVEVSEVLIASPETQRVKVFKPKCASNIHEALRLMKIRKQLARLEKQNQLSLASVDLNTSILLSSSIDLDQLKHNGTVERPNKQENMNRKMLAEIETVPSPLQNTVISKDNWDAMEAKLSQEVSSQFREFNEENFDESTRREDKDKEADQTTDCKYFDSVNIEEIEFIQFVSKFTENVEKSFRRTIHKRKIVDNDSKNNNKRLKTLHEPKRKIVRKTKEKSNTVKYNSVTDIAANEKFSLPLSPAESDKSIDKKDETVLIPLKTKRNSINKINSQRYSSDDLYKPRLTFTTSRRRGAKNLEN